MNRFILMTVLLAVAAPALVHAKRIPAPKVEPLVYEGVRYVVPNNNGCHGYIQAWDARTNKKLWEVTVFRIFTMPFLEQDVQWVFIKGIKAENGKLIVNAERDRTYSVDLKTRWVKRVKWPPTEKPRPIEER